MHALAERLLFKGIINMEYTKKVVERYTKYRDNYRLTDPITFGFIKSLGLKNKVILDFGCGQGTDSMKFVNLGAKVVVGTDQSRAMIDLAKKENHHCKIQFIKTDGRTLPLTNGQFDIVFANYVIHYFRNTKQQFMEISRVLKKGGHFLAVYNCLTSNSKLVNRRVPMVLGKGISETHINIFSKSPQGIKNNLKDAGLELIEHLQVANPVARIDPAYSNKLGFKRRTFLLLSKKV